MIIIYWISIEVATIFKKNSLSEHETELFFSAGYSMPLPISPHLIFQLDQGGWPEP